MAASPVLTEHSSRMDSLLSTRAEEMSKLSIAEVDRPVRMEAEQLFRNRFMDIVLSSLTTLAWPPTLEAFSNPLPGLNTQINTVHAAMLYMLEKGVAPYSNETLTERRDISKTVKRKESKPGWKGTLDVESSIQSLDISRPSSSSSVDSDLTTKSLASKQLHDQSAGDKNVKDRTKSNVSVQDDDCTFTESTPKDGITPQRKSKIGKRATNRPLSSGLSIDLPSSARSSKADSVISDLHSERDSVFSARSSKASINLESSRQSATSVPSSAGKGICNCATSCEISQSIEMLQFQNQSLSKQLKFMQSSIAARDEAEMKIAILIKDLMRSVREVHEISSMSRDINTKEEMDKKKDKSTSQSRPSSASSSSTTSRREGLKPPVVKQDIDPPNLWKSIYSQISDLNNAWIQTTNDARKAAFSSIDAHRTTLSLFRKAKSSSAIKIFDGPSKILSHKIFGLQPAIDVKRDETMTNSNEDTGTYGLDLNRIHQLQRDLLQFSSQVETHIGLDDLEVNENNVFDFPESLQESSKIEKTQNMRVKGFQLIMHLAALAPLASLTSVDHKSSSLFGLEQLLIELQKEDSKERLPLKIQRLLDRARMEHLALAKCYQKSLSLLDEWSVAAKNFSEKLTHDTNPHDYSKMIQYTESVGKNVHTLIGAFDEAENVRIAPSEGGRSVPPMDMLSRGYLGEEMANLVNTIRATVENLRDLSDYTRDIQESLKSKVSKDRLNRTNIAQSLRNAHKTSADYVQQRSPSKIYSDVQEQQQQQQQQTPYSSPGNSKATKHSSGSPAAGVKSRPEFSF